jgi:hypothetical protein
VSWWSWLENIDTLSEKKETVVHTHTHAHTHQICYFHFGFESQPQNTSSIFSTQDSEWPLAFLKKKGISKFLPFPWDSSVPASSSSTGGTWGRNCTILALCPLAQVFRSCCCHQIHDSFYALYSVLGGIRKLLCLWWLWCLALRVWVFSWAMGSLAHGLRPMWNRDKSLSPPAVSSENQIHWTRPTITNTILSCSFIYSFGFRDYQCFLGIGFYLTWSLWFFFYQFIF